MSSPQSRNAVRVLLGIAFVLTGVALVFMRGQALPDDYFWSETDAQEYQEVHEAAHSDSIHGHHDHTGHDHAGQGHEMDSAARTRVEEVRQKLQNAQQSGQWARQAAIVLGIALMGMGAYLLSTSELLRRTTPSN